MQSSEVELEGTQMLDRVIPRRCGVRPVACCALCGEGVLVGEEIVRCGALIAHYDCYRYNAPQAAVERFLGIVRERMG